MAGTSLGRYVVEMDGVAAIRASEVSGINVKHEPFKIGVGDQANPILGRGNYECDEVTMKHAHAINSTGQELWDYINAYIKGISTEKPNFRVIQLGEDGYTATAIWEMIEIVPTGFAQESNKGDSNDASYFTFKFKPTDIDFFEF